MDRYRGSGQLAAAVLHRSSRKWPVGRFLGSLPNCSVRSLSIAPSGLPREPLPKRSRSASRKATPWCFFAEGTSSDGNRVLPFRSALIGAAKEAMTSTQDDGQDGNSPQKKVWIQPLSIAYTALHGMPMGRQHRHMAAWYGDMDLIPHLWALMKEGALDVTAHPMASRSCLTLPSTARKPPMPPNVASARPCCMTCTITPSKRRRK